MAYMQRELISFCKLLDLIRPKLVPAVDDKRRKKYHKVKGRHGGTRTLCQMHVASLSKHDKSFKLNLSVFLKIK